MAISGGIVERHKDGGLIITCKTAAAIVAGQIVALNGNAEFEVDVAGANSVAGKGVALRTASAAADYIPVAFPGSQSYKLKATGAVNAGDYVKTGAAGTVVAIAADGDPRLIFGIALVDIADTATGEVAVL